MASIFTKIINREIPASIIYEDEKHIAFLDIAPFEKGHTLVVPKKEYVNIMEMPEDEYLELSKIVLKIAQELEKKLDCGINIVQNNKTIAHQEVMHVHFHIIPRRLSKPLYNLENKEVYEEGEIENYKNKLSFN